MSRVYSLGPIDYASTAVPSLYHCGKCGESGVKLWREYNSLRNQQSLRCGDCACAEQSRDGKSHSVAQISERSGVCVTRTFDREKQPTLYSIHDGKDVGGDQIGYRIPAVPTPDGSTYWSYGAVPNEGVTWWKRLPLRKVP